MMLIERFLKIPNSVRNFTLLFIALFFLSQSANIVRWSETPIEVIGFWRLLLTSFLLMPFGLSHLKSINNTISQSSFNKNLKITILSGVFLFLHFWTFFYAAHNTKIANTMIVFSTNPLFTTLLTWIFFREKITFKLLLAYFFAFVGLWILFSNSFETNLQHFSTAPFYGDLAALLSALFYALYMLTGRDARKIFPNTLYGFIINLVASSLFGTCLLVKKMDFTNYHLKTWFGILILTLGPSLMGHAILTYLLKHLNITIISCSKLIEPILSSIVALILFHEPTSQNTTYAFIFTCASVVIMFWPTQKKNI